MEAAVVGAAAEQQPAAGGPAIYLYQRNQGGSENWGATQTLNGAAATFGNSLALRLGTLVTGAYTSDHERGTTVVHQLQ